MRLRYVLPFLFLVTSAAAIEIDFATVLKDLDDAPYRFCSHVKPAVPDVPGQPGTGKPPECDEYTNHTIGLLAFGALSRPPEKPADSLSAQVEEARSAVLSRKVYPGKNEKHVVDISGSEQTLIFNAIASNKQQLPKIEWLSALELIDPVRVKAMLEK